MVKIGELVCAPFFLSYTTIQDYSKSQNSLEHGHSFIHFLTLIFVHCNRATDLIRACLHNLLEFHAQLTQLTHFPQTSLIQSQNPTYHSLASIGNSFYVTHCILLVHASCSKIETGRFTWMTYLSRSLLHSHPLLSHNKFHILILPFLSSNQFQIPNKKRVKWLKYLHDLIQNCFK